MKKHIITLAVLTLVAFAGAASADDGTYKGRMNATGNNCRNNTYFEIEATVAGNKVDGTLLGSAFTRGPSKFSGDATATGFSAVLVFAALGNLRVELTGTRVDADTYTIATKWNGGGASNCESTGPAKKA